MVLLGEDLMGGFGERIRSGFEVGGGMRKGFRWKGWGLMLCFENVDVARFGEMVYREAVYM
jgi:hypothetical protein